MNSIILRPMVFAYGFRSSFLLAGVGAMLLVPLWALSFVAGTPLGSAWPPMLWHAHEMLFGFVASAMAGFLLTAVPSWTGQKGSTGAPLVVLASLWLTARVLIASSSLWPAVLIAAIDLAFLPTLGILVAKPLLSSRNRNTKLLAVLGLFWLTDLVFQIGLIRHDAPLALQALKVGIDIVLVLVTVIGGRLVPSFTSSSLRPLGLQDAVHNRTSLSGLAIAGMIAVTLSDIVWPESRIAGAVAGVAAGLQATRLLQWATWRTLRQPIVWVLHLSYAWLPVGLALKAIALLSGAAFAAFWLHALTIGALATMILAVMTRASLGHTGRALIVDPWITVAYLLLTAAALVRVFGLSAFRMNYPMVIIWSALFWTIAFALFVVVYAPILCGPRADGKAG
ncbi:MAG: NnrS family protein [Steroidobacteraceae bacterium]